MRRDHRTCQYCGRTDGPMTIDHVVPRSHGGKETWENLVCACSACNSRKGNRTLQEAGMDLLHKPSKPNLRSLIFQHKGPVNSDWRAYLSLG
jgi:5-methylcytosine-specific restriction endonuclease McrA